MVLEYHDPNLTAVKEAWGSRATGLGHIGVGRRAVSGSRGT